MALDEQIGGLPALNDFLIRAHWRIGQLFQFGPLAKDRDVL